MPQPSDPLAQQYRDASNLNARIRLHERYSTNELGWFRWAFDRIDLPPAGRMLELGCGPGDLWRENQDRIPAQLEVTLSDISRGMIRQARQNLTGGPHRFAFCQVDAQSIPLADRSLDAVIANFMLHTVPHMAKALSEIRRVLRPGGRLYAATFGKRHMQELLAMLQPFLPNAHPGPGSAAAFILENGGEQLAEWFANVELYRYDDGLVVTEARPLVAYALSLIAGKALVGERRAAFTRSVASRLAADGAIHITKDSGMLVAVRHESG